MNTYPLKQQPQEGDPHRAASAMPKPGTGTELTVTANGYTYSVPPAGGSAFRGPWYPRLLGGSLVLQRGVIDLIDPRIGQKLMYEMALPLDRAQVNERGESWACLEVEPNAEGKLNGNGLDGKTTRVEVIHTKEPKLETPEKGRHALALILWSGGRPVRVMQIAYFNLQYHRISERGVVRHLFL